MAAMQIRAEQIWPGEASRRISRRRDSGSRITFKEMTAGELARFWRGQEILVRQGIARGRRHVAPARLLC